MYYYSDGKLFALYKKLVKLEKGARFKGDSETMTKEKKMVYK